MDRNLDLDLNESKMDPSNSNSIVISVSAMLLNKILEDFIVCLNNLFKLNAIKKSLDLFFSLCEGHLQFFEKEDSAAFSSPHY